jgi:hypothetical protein
MAATLLFNDINYLDGPPPISRRQPQHQKLLLHISYFVTCNREFTISSLKSLFHLRVAARFMDESIARKDSWNISIAAARAAVHPLQSDGLGLISK